MIIFAAAVAASLLNASVAKAAETAGPDQLPRKALLGISPVPVPQPVAARIKQRGGALVDTVTPGLTAASLGIRKADVILSLNNQPIGSPTDLIAAAGRLTGGAPVRLSLWRDGQQLTFTGKASPRPFESYAGATTRYGAVRHGTGLLRDIMVLPEGAAADTPILFLLQGYTCASIDYPNPESEHRQLIQALVGRGIGTYRVEKAGVGDSRSPRHCRDTDFDEELAAFQSAYDQLEKSGVHADRIFMLGHSMGGLQAPLLAAKRPPRGIAVYGTVLRNWHDYVLDVTRFQSTYFGTEDPVQSAERMETARKLLGRFYLDRVGFKALAAESPEQERVLREVLGWDGSDTLFGRSERFAQDLPHLPLLAGWRDSRSRVLSMYGEADIVALNDEDHRLIATVVNHYRPGTARYVEIAGADHGMGQVGSRETVRVAAQRTGEPPQGKFEPAVASRLADWIEESMRQPPVRTLTFSAPAAPPQS